MVGTMVRKVDGMDACALSAANTEPPKLKFSSRESVQSPNGWKFTKPVNACPSWLARYPFLEASKMPAAYWNRLTWSKSGPLDGEALSLPRGLDRTPAIWSERGSGRSIATASHAGSAERDERAQTQVDAHSRRRYDLSGRCLVGVRADRGLDRLLVLHPPDIMCATRDHQSQIVRPEHSLTHQPGLPGERAQFCRFCRMYGFFPIIGDPDVVLERFEQAGRISMSDACSREPPLVVDRGRGRHGDSRAHERAKFADRR